jgi:hypothetical protein
VAARAGLDYPKLPTTFEQLPESSWASRERNRSRTDADEQSGKGNLTRGHSAGQPQSQMTAEILACLTGPRVSVILASAFAAASALFS